MKTLRALAMGCMLTAGAVMVAGTAAAQPGRGDRPGVNRDFSLTYEQAKERWPNLTRERFNQMDTNGDGVLTPADRIGREGAPGRPGAGNRPGPARDFSLTYEQAKERWPNLTRERFDEMDTDGDGVLTPADRAGWRDRAGRPGGPPADAPRRGRPEVAPEDGDAKADETTPPRSERGPRGDRPRDGRGDGRGFDRDFSLTYEQAQERFPNFTRERFDAIDQNGDGVISAEEMRAWRESTGGPGPRGDGPRGDGARDGRGPRPAPAE